MVSKRQSIHGVVMGAGDRSYVIRDQEIDVMRNVMGGVEDAGVRANNCMVLQQSSLVRD